MDEIATKLLADVIEEVKENRVQPLSSRLQEKLIEYVSHPTQRAADGGYCVCENPEQPWWGDAFMCHRCNRPRR